MLSLAKVNGKAGKFERKASLTTNPKTRTALTKLAKVIKTRNFPKVGDLALGFYCAGTIDYYDISKKDWALFGVEFE